MELGLLISLREKMPIRKEEGHQTSGGLSSLSGTLMAAGDVRFVPKADIGHLIRSLHQRGRSRTSRWLNGVADVPRSYGNLIKLDFERTERIRDSICKRGGWADRATFADTLNAERIER